MTIDAIKYLMKRFPDNWEEIGKNIENNNIDFTVGGYRFISTNDIDAIMQEEMSSDHFTLGNLAPDIIANVLKISIDSVRSVQNAELFDVLGELLMSHIEKVQDMHLYANDYGHFFATDEETRKIIVDDVVYHYFKVN